ncbi:hypothetical protein BCR34DRAFT_607889 [Clohesyomyces aquaticus]|uniref:Uncharacterized protein n=1 Tax=Clohesyomyces aquaticus TaxID=1231657 RepID=A0A1Y1YCK4_9PLEO|nr:hypothetical protein BCR34DRAFT_607889 [Clohesyomyces aquaticus]
MDTELLESPHLLDVGVNREFIAHGCIWGLGYKSVSLRMLKKSGLEAIFPDLEPLFVFKHEPLRELFKKKGVTLSENDLEVAKRIGSLFGDPALPVLIALLNLRHRP